MPPEKPKEEDHSEIKAESGKARKPLNPHYLAVAMGQANLTYARVLATLAKENEQNNPDVHE